MTKKIGVGMVGVTSGRSWASVAHIPALRALDDYEVVAVANSSLASAQEAAAAEGIATAYGDAAELARDPAVDLVAVTVKVPHHRKLVDAALDAKKDVYCEWPLGNGLADALEIAERTKALGVRNVIGLQARLAPEIRYLRDLIRDGYVGEVLSTTLVGSGGSWGPAVNLPHAYTHDKANGATMLTIPFGHTIDALRYCLGEFREVHATMAQRRKTFVIIETGEEHPLKVEDQIVVGGVLEGGAVVSAHYRGGPTRGTNLLWEINGTEGDIQLTSFVGAIQMFDLTLKGGRGADIGLTELTVPDHYRTAPAALASFPVNVAEIYQSYSGHGLADEPTPDFDDAISLHRLLDAIERSAATGQRITL